MTFLQKCDRTIFFSKLHIAIMEVAVLSLYLVPALRLFISYIMWDPSAYSEKPSGSPNKRVTCLCIRETMLCIFLC